MTNVCKYIVYEMEGDVRFDAPSEHVLWVFDHYINLNSTMMLEYLYIFVDSIVIALFLPKANIPKVQQNHL